MMISRMMDIPLGHRRFVSLHTKVLYTISYVIKKCFYSHYIDFVLYYPSCCGNCKTISKLGYLWRYDLFPLLLFSITSNTSTFIIIIAI